MTAAAGNAPNIAFADTVAGDVAQTGADIAVAADRLGWKPTVDLETGVANHLKFINRYGLTTAAAKQGGLP